MTARELAVESFWTERPLVRLFVERTGQRSFSVQELITFAEKLTTDELAHIQRATQRARLTVIQGGRAA